MKNFKNDRLFKFTFCDDDEDSKYLLKTIFKSIYQIDIENLITLNPELIPSNQQDKKMITDTLKLGNDSNIVHVEMQNTDFSENQRKRFQLYACSIMAGQEKKGDKDYQSYVKNLFQVIFINGIDEKRKQLYYIYESQDEVGLEPYCLIHRAYIQMPYINEVAKEKGLENLNEFEAIIYLIENGTDSDIIKLRKYKGVKIMENKYDVFTQEKVVELSKLGYELKEWAEKADLKDQYKKGVYATQLDNVKQMISLYYPNEQADFLNELTIEQLDMVFKQLLHQVPLDKIKELLN